MILNLRHVGIVVSDMDRAIRFYQKLGCNIISRGPEAWRDITIDVCKMTHKIELICGDWKSHVAFKVDAWPDIDGEGLPYSKFWLMTKHGVRFITDPDGNIIEFVKEDK